MNNEPNSNIDFHQDVNKIEIEEKASLKAKSILTLSLLSFWIPIITSIIALIMIPKAKQEIEESNGTLTGLKMIKWGKTISWLTIWFNIAGAILLIIIYSTATPLLIEGCKEVPAICPLIQSL